jgi:predicted ATPase
LVGLGGSGKTRLAQEAAASQADNYPHGVYFIALAPLDSVHSVVPTVAEALGFRFYEEGEPQQQLLDYLRQKRMLILFDNFEHLVEGAGLLTDILHIAPDVKILATSRARLNVGGEHLFPVAGMHFPDRERDEDIDRYSAVKLFLENASRVRPSFEPTADDMLDVARICCLVEGMPLAILLATAWLEMLTPREIVAEMRQSLDFLDSELRDVPERQRSMRAVFDYTWDLLSEREQELFAGLSVFRGGFTREAAREITGASLRDLMALVHRSLLYRTPNRQYDVHGLIRQYAAEKLDESPATSEAVRDRHCAYYMAALQRWKADLRGSRQQTALAEMDAEIENARRAWNWAVEQGQAERLGRSLDGLCHFLKWRGRYQEGEAACRMATEKLEATASGSELLLLARILLIRGSFNWKLGRTDFARQHLRRCLALLEQSESDDQGVRAATARARLELGYIASASDRREAQRLYMQSLALFRELGDHYGIAEALYALGEVARLVGVYEEAKRFHEESLAVRQTLGDQSGIADSLRGLSNIAVKQGQLEGGERLIRQSVAIHRDLGNRGAIADGLHYLGQTAMYLGEYAEAYTKLEESIALYSDLGDRNGLAISHGGAAFVEFMRGRFEQTCVHAQMCLNLARETGHQYGIAVGLGMLGGVAVIEGAHAEAQRLLQECVIIHRQIGQREEMGWALSALAATKIALGNLPEARQHIYEALQTAADIRSFMTSLTVLLQVVLLLIVQGEKDRAVELYALLSRYPAVTNSRASEDLVGRLVAAIADSLPPEVVTAAQERGRARDLEATVAELLAELEC